MWSILTALLVPLWAAVPGSAAGAEDPVTASPAGIDEGFEAVATVLEGKNIRHRWVRNALTPFFDDTDGRDRFLLNLVARVRGARITDGKIRRIHWRTVEVDEQFGYVEAELELCGLWHKMIPRCADARVAWREIDGAWHLLPPDEIRLDPGVR